MLLSDFRFLGNLLWAVLANEAPFCGLRFWSKRPETIVNNFTVFISLKRIHVKTPSIPKRPYQNAPHLTKTPPLLFRIKVILPKRPHFFIAKTAHLIIFFYSIINKGNNKITELRTISQRESQNSQLYKQTKSVNNRNMRFYGAEYNSASPRSMLLYSAP